MSKTVQFKRGNSNVGSTYIGAQGEITVNTDNYTLNVHDGITPGGYSILNTTVSNIGNLVITGQTINGSLANTDITISPINGNVDITANLVLPNISINDDTIKTIDSNLNFQVINSLTSESYTLTLDLDGYLNIPEYIKSNLGGAEIQFGESDGILLYADFSRGGSRISLNEDETSFIFANTDIKIITGNNKEWHFGSDGSISMPGNLLTANLLISHVAANNTVQTKTLNNSDLEITATDGISASSIYLWANNQRMSFNTVSNAFDFNFNGQLSATDFTASKNSNVGYSFYAEGGDYSGFRHSSGPPDVITIVHEGNVFAGFYGNYTTQLYGNLVVSSDGETFGSFPDAYIQVYSNVDSYSQFVLQNINDGSDASTDVVVTADNGNDNTYYINMGILGSNHAVPNFFGDVRNYDDGYLIVVGNDATGGAANVGNLILGSTNGVVKTFVGNLAEANVVTVVTETGLMPGANVTYSLGSETNQWKDLWVSNNTIYIGGTPLSIVDGNLTVSGNVVSGGGTVDLSITIPGNTYKGFGARYGRVYDNTNSNELTISKIVIFKNTAITGSSIDSNGGETDDFEVTGLADSDIIAMFVLYGDTNSEKSITTLRNFTRTVIDTVILVGGVEGNINTISDMRTAFYANIGTLTAAAGGLVNNFQFFVYDTTFSVSFNTAGQGTGSGFNVNSLSYNINTDQISVSGWSNGPGYSVNDVIVIPGTSITYQGSALESPDNDITITITQVGITGFIQSFTVSGILPRPPAMWPENQISDGGADQYDNANYINTNLAQEISYAGGEIVTDASTEFGPGSSYVALYNSSIFGFIATGSSATKISTSGGSGADGNSATDTGELLTVDRTYDPALSNLTLTNNPLKNDAVTFIKSDGGSQIDVLIEDNGEGVGVGITRDNQGGIYNPYREGEWDSDISPGGTLWSVGNTEDLSDIVNRSYLPFYAAYGYGGLGYKVPGSKAIMYLPDNGKYYLVEWLTWTQGGNGGGFSYIRREIDVTQVEEGLRFADGTSIKTALGIGRVKSTAPGSRRIEEVTGYKEVSVTETETIVLTTTASRSVVNSNQIWVDVTTTTIDEILNNYDEYEITDTSTIQFSLDNTTWYNYDFGYSTTGNERGFVITTSVTYNQGDTIYFKYDGGGSPQTWWNKNELPGGGGNFRGAVIDYHAYTGEATWIGTIHIVDDDGDENITHTEVSSGSSDSENDDLWVVQDEGTISYRRIDGESKTMKVHWTAKVFYGSETYD
jgi:hypothetical protein